MRIGMIAIAALLVVGVVAVEGVALTLGHDGAITGSAAASCIEDGVTGMCHNVCPPVMPPDWACTL